MILLDKFIKQMLIIRVLPNLGKYTKNYPYKFSSILLKTYIYKNVPKKQYSTLLFRKD
jgi:hypothetical protein